MWFVYKMENYSALKNKSIMKFAGKWMELENIILSEVSQTQKGMHGMYSLISGYWPKSTGSPSTGPKVPNNNECPKEDS